MTWTEDQIKSMLRDSDKAVERAVVRLYNLQTLDERAAETTKHDNGVGFNSADAGYGSYLAKWLKTGKRLNDKHLGRARRMVTKYARQLAAWANVRR